MKKTNLLPYLPKLTEYDKIWLIEWIWTVKCKDFYRKPTERELMFIDIDVVKKTLNYILSHNQSWYVSKTWAKDLKERLEI